ncbi:MAG: ABC transporter permease, partial [Holophagales bacterium]|nr:ABC transporter permease [Holophagales bacterium]
MNTLRFVAAQAWQEFRAGCRGPLLAIVFPGLIGYALIVILNADYMREMGATEVPRNSPHVIYLMMAGQAVWIFFVWAWLFGLNVVRDRNASLHEVVLSTPVSLPALLFGRYLGALALSTLLPVATAIGFWLVPALGALGIIPPDAVGPHPWFAMAHSLLLFTLPTAAGVGALFLCAAIRTRSIAGPFAVAAMLMLVWMVAMVVVRGGDASPAVATLLDASGFAEIEEQTNLMTPREKAVAVIE